MRRNRIQEEWESYRREVMPKDAGTIQVQETRRAFYAGAVAAFNIYRSVGDEEVTEDEGVKTLSDMQAELGEFPKLIRAGRM